MFSLFNKLEHVDNSITILVDSLFLAAGQVLVEQCVSDVEMGQGDESSRFRVVEVRGYFDDGPEFVNALVVFLIEQIKFSEPAVGVELVLNDEGFVQR